MNSSGTVKNPITGKGKIMNNFQRHSLCFTLIELLIVIAIIAIILTSKS